MLVSYQLIYSEYLYLYLHDLTLSLPQTASCLTFENESAMKKEATKWQKGRDIWWQVIILCDLSSTAF